MPENIGQHRQDSSDSGGHEFFDVTNAFFFSERADAVLHTVQAIGNRRYVVNAVKLYNASGGAIACGAGPLLHCNKWQAGEWDDANIGDDYTDKTDEAQNTVADDFALQTLAADDGHVLGASELWSGALYTVGVAEAGGGTVHEWNYWNGSWSALTLLNQPVFTGTGSAYLMFEPPEDWELTDSAGEGIPDGIYAIRYRATTPPGATAALATQVALGHPLKLGFFNVPADGRASYAGPKIIMGTVGEGMMVGFGTHASGNHFLLAGERFSI